MIEEDHDNEEEEKKEGDHEVQEAEAGGLFAYLYEKAKATVWALWEGVIWFKSFFFAREDGTGQLQGSDFSESFESKLRNLGLQQDNEIKFFKGTFHELCE